MANELSYWDIAAGIIIVKEAGGFVDYLDKSDNHTKKLNLVATNSLIHQELIDLIKKYCEKLIYIIKIQHEKKDTP